ncbi:hypothetical protein F4778DRAFT_749846 [Xylariomycetidae sp. FL2044]|nr:hypothetical protein F4778DRAFT_749846 [Xylariomycetidae sp. FL2044]
MPKKGKTGELNSAPNQNEHADKRPTRKEYDTLFESLYPKIVEITNQQLSLQGDESVSKRPYYSDLTIGASGAPGIKKPYRHSSRGIVETPIIKILLQRDLKDHDSKSSQDHQGGTESLQTPQHPTICKKELQGCVDTIQAKLAELGAAESQSWERTYPRPKLKPFADHFGVLVECRESHFPAHPRTLILPSWEWEVRGDDGKSAMNVQTWPCYFLYDAAKEDDIREWKARYLIVRGQRKDKLLERVDEGGWTYGTENFPERGGDGGL